MNASRYNSYATQRSAAGRKSAAHRPSAHCHGGRPSPFRVSTLPGDGRWGPLKRGTRDAAIEAGMDQYAVLVFREQDITDEEQIAFTRHFGELERYSTPGHIRRRKEQRLGPGIADFSNLDKDGRIMSAEDRVWFFKLGDRLWHSDSSFRPV